MKKIAFVVIGVVLFTPAFVLAQSSQSTHQTTPLIPPFIREGDRPIFQFQLTNSSQLDWGGTAHFTLIDSLSKEAVDGWFFNSLGNQYFTIDPLKKDFIGFPLEIPFEFNKKAQWKFCTITQNDTNCTQGQVRILPWPYENEPTAATLSPKLPTIRKKIMGKSVEETMVVRKGELIQVEIEIHSSPTKKPFQITENLPAGLLMNPHSLIVKGDKNQILLTGKNFPKDTLVQASDFSIKEDFSKTSFIKISYQLRATYLGSFHIPPTLVMMTDTSPSISRSAIGLLTIE